MNSIMTKAGLLTVEISNDPKYPGLTVYLNGEQQIAVIEADRDGTHVRVMVWANPDEEDPTNEIRVLGAV